VANLATQTGILTVDLIDDGHADTISFHDEHNELHRASIVGREAVHYAPERTAHVHARAWTGGQCIYVFGALLIHRGSVYTVRFDA
jgi:hypothetical protein